MKQIIFSLLVLVLSVKSVNGQDSLRPKPHLSTLQNDFPGMIDKTSPEFYFQKSAKAKTAGWILLSVGSALTIAGVVAYNDAMSREYTWANWDESMVNTAGAEFAIIAGTSMVVTSIPLFIKSHSLRKKAMQASASFNLQPYKELQQANLATKYMPSISFRINL